MILEELLKVIPETERLFVTYGEKEEFYIGHRHNYPQITMFLNKKVKTVRVCWFTNDDDNDDAYLHIGIEE